MEGVANKLEEQYRQSQHEGCSRDEMISHDEKLNKVMIARDEAISISD